MIDSSQLIPIGTLGRVHGIRGEINFYATVNSDSLIEVLEGEQDLFLFLEIDGLPVPFLVESLRPKTEESALIKFAKVDSREEAERYDNLSVYIEPHLIGEDTEFEPLHFIGYTLLDAEEQVVGKVIDIDTNTANLLLIVEKESDQEEIMIPIADELVHYIDMEKRQISLSIAQGLV